MNNDKMIMIRSVGMNRNEAYTWLAGELGIKKSECHFGWFDVEMCEKVLQIIKKVVAK